MKILKPETLRHKTVQGKMRLMQDRRVTRRAQNCGHSYSVTVSKELELVYKPVPPYPQRLRQEKKIQFTQDIFETLRKVEINIPLIDAIKLIPSYAKFIKELCTNKRSLRDHEEVKLNKEVSAVLSRKFPPKLKDPGSFTIPCKIGDHVFERALLDLGSSINLLPFSIYK